MIISAALATTYALSRKSEPVFHRQLIQHAAMIAGALTAYYSYIFIISLAFSNPTFIDYSKEVISNLFLCLCYFLILSNKTLNNKFYDLLSVAVSMLGWSSIATYILILFIPDSELIIHTIEIKGYSNGDSDFETGVVLFPFTMVYGKFTPGDFYLLRVGGFFREAGIFQAISCFFLLYEFFHNKRVWLMIGLAIGTILTFSTMGIASLFLALAIIGYYSIKKQSLRALVFIALAAITIPTFIYAPYIGYAEKEKTHGESFSERSHSMSNGIEATSNNPLGYGVEIFRTQNSGINMIAAMGSTGVPGFLLQAFILSGISRQKSWHRVAIFFPILITALFAQPLIGSPLIYILSMAALDTKTHPRRHIQTN